MNKKLNFYQSFKGPLIYSVKNSTIRSNNYQNISIGDSVDLFIGKNIIKTVKITRILKFNYNQNKIYLNNQELDNEQILKLVLCEGFKSEADFVFALKNYFKQSDFEGVFFYWGD